MNKQIKQRRKQITTVKNQKAPFDDVWKIIQEIEQQGQKIHTNMIHLSTKIKNQSDNDE